MSKKPTKKTVAKKSTPKVDSPPKAAKANPADSKPKSLPIVFHEQEVIFRDRAHGGELTCDEAEALLALNQINRPDTPASIKKYAHDILRKKWRMNGETIVLDKYSRIGSGQNRLKGLLLAEKIRKSDPAKYKEKYGWHGPCTMPVLLACGFNHEYFDTLDDGFTRKGGHVFFRRLRGELELMKDGNGKLEFGKGAIKKIGNVMATAVRTVWLRMGNQFVSDAPKFPLAAMVEFYEQHPKLLDAVLFVVRADHEKGVSGRVSPAYLAAAMYLAGTANTDRTKFDKGTGSIKTDTWQDCEDFVIKFAEGVDLKADDPALVLGKLCDSQKSAARDGASRNRDVILNNLILAFSLVIDGKKCPDKKLLQWKPGKDAVPRLGGLDVDMEPKEPVVDATVPAKEDAKPSTKKPAKRKPSTSKAKRNGTPSTAGTTYGPPDAEVAHETTQDQDVFGDDNSDDNE